ncbi:hypothetical protein DPV74_27945 [Burkholderia sp. HAN2018]|nr:hypothetical protein [Burkholderia sp. HAN2018]
MDGRPFTPIHHANSHGRRREMFHALYMPRAARGPRVARAIHPPVPGRPGARLYCETGVRRVRIGASGRRMP